MRLESILQTSSQKYADAIALAGWCGEAWQEMSYQTLFEKAKQFALALKEKDLKAGERVVLISENQCEAVAALFGIWVAKATAVLIDPVLPENVLEEQIRIADARFIILSSEKKSLCNKVNSDFFVILEKNKQNWIHQNNIISKKIDQDCDEAIATLLFTSGTTGNTKAVMLTHDNFWYLKTSHDDYLKTFEKQCLLTILPMFHVAGLFTSFLQPLSIGAKIVFFNNFDKDILLNGFLKYQPNVLITVPRLLEVLDQKIAQVILEKNIVTKILFCFFKKLNYFSQKIFDINLGQYLFQSIYKKFGNQLTHIFTGSASISSRVQKNFLAYGFELLCSYGLTETCGPITFSSHETRFIEGNVGQCVNTNDLWVDDIGEIIYHGPALMKGYFRDKAATEEAIEKGCFHTNDFGKSDEEKNLFILGRIKERLVFSDGKKAFPEEIERCYSTIEHIKEYAVFSIQKNNTDHAIIAFIPEENTDGIVTREKILKHASTLHSPYRIVDVMIVESIPHSSTLKVKRHLLREQYETVLKKNNVNQATSSRGEAPRDPEISTRSGLDELSRGMTDLQLHQDVESLQENNVLMKEIIECFETVFPDKKNKITIKTTFAECEMDSFTAVELTTILNKKFNLSLTPAIFWFSTSIEELYANNFLQKCEVSKSMSVRSQNKDIAIIAMEGVFPCAKNISQYWKNLCEGIDAIQEVPKTRWNNEDYYDSYALAPGKINSKWGGFIDLCDDFDGELFGLKKRIVDGMDPEQKILLTLTQKLLNQASIDKKNTGCFIGTGFPEYLLQKVRAHSVDNINATTLGLADFSSFSRICYHFGLEGPAMLIKTACSSSLAAVHQAVRALQAGDCDTAIAGGINLVLSPDISVFLSKGGFLSPDGRCKTFDASANGYVRSDGAGLVLLKPLEAAKRDGDTILAIIAGSAINQDGASNGIAAPNGQSQVRCYQKSLENAGISANQVGYIESHGSGTALGDAIEMKSIQAVYDDVNRDNSLYVGAVKSVIGHCESAAGIAGLIKTILVLQHQVIPKNLHYHLANPAISFEQSSIVLPIKTQSFEKSAEFAAVSSFGISGTNVHTILRVS